MTSAAARIFALAGLAAQPEPQAAHDTDCVHRRGVLQDVAKQLDSLLDSLGRDEMPEASDITDDVEVLVDCMEDRSAQVDDAAIALAAAALHVALIARARRTASGG